MEVTAQFEGDDRQLRRPNDHSLDVVRILYFGRFPDVAAELPLEQDHLEVQVVGAADRALERIEAGMVDCLVFDPGVWRIDAQEFLERVDEAGDVIVVLHRERFAQGPDAAVEEPDVDSDLYDETYLPGITNPLVDVIASVRTDESPGTRPIHDDPRFLDTLLDGLVEVVFVFDLDGRLRWWNDRLCEVTGYDDEEIREMNPLEFVAEEDRDRLADVSVAPDGVQTYEFRLRTEDGDLVPYEFAGSVVRDSDDEPLYTCAIGRDVSERWETRRELDETIEELKRSNEELEQFAYVVSHDLREPLRTVSNYVGLLERRYGDELDENAREFIDYALEGAERTRRRMDDILTYSRVGRGDLDRSPVQLENVLATVEENLADRLDDAELVVDELPTVSGDEGQLVQVFQNLVGNAVDHGGDTPEIHVSAEREDDQWVVSVSDDGPGIDPDLADVVFDIFRSGPDSEGSGIGLTIAKKIIDRHGGSIRLETTPGEGTTFLVSLPAVDSDDEMAGRDEETADESR